MDLYNRQKDLNIENDISVTVVGCGGIGYWVSKFLVMSGIPEIHVFDNDIFEPHNLNRIDIPLNFVGKNKADVVKQICSHLRPDCNVKAYPFKFTENTITNTTWLADCTDKIKSQEENQALANKNGMRYVKFGYDGDHISINDEVAEWGEAEDGYTITPSWIVPAVLIAALGVGKILKFHNKEMSCFIQNLYIFD